MSSIVKLNLLLSLLQKHPSEFIDRIRHFLEVKLDCIYGKPVISNDKFDLDNAIAILNEYFPSLNHYLLEEAELLEIEEFVISKTASLKNEGPFRTTHNTNFALARFCYAICRALSPEIVLETGVAYGVTSAYILQAMHKNGKGKLYSVDLPPLGKLSDNYVGSLIPEELRDRWQLSRGSSRRVIPDLVKELGPINMFIHDSLHTYANMSWEFKTVYPHLLSGGLIISDDIADNRAFFDWVSQTKPLSPITVRKFGNSKVFGVAVKP